MEPVVVVVVIAKLRQRAKLCNGDRGSKTLNFKTVQFNALIGTLAVL